MRIDSQAERFQEMLVNGNLADPIASTAGRRTCCASMSKAPCKYAVAHHLSCFHILSIATSLLAHTARNLKSSTKVMETFAGVSPFCQAGGGKRLAGGCLADSDPSAASTRGGRGKTSSRRRGEDLLAHHVGSVWEGLKGQGGAQKESSRRSSFDARPRATPYMQLTSQADFLKFAVVI